MLTLEIPNFTSTNILEVAKVASPAEEGQSSFEIDNPQNISAYDYILIGRPGGDVSSIRQVIDVSDKTITLDDILGFEILEGTDITRLVGNQIKVYTVPYVAGVAPSASDATALTDGIFDIDPDQSATEFTDPNGSSNLWYGYTYYNEYTEEESDLSATQFTRDNYDNDYTSLDAIRDAADFNSATYITNAMIEPHRAAAQDYINGALYGLYVVPFSKPVNSHIADITKRFAAGYLLQDQYKSNPEIGQAKIDGAQKDLDRIVNKSVRLTGLIEEDTSIPDAGGFSAWPNQNTASTPGYNGGGERMFRVSDMQGYNTRRF